MTLKKPTILIDKEIPFVDEYFGRQFNLSYYDANSLKDYNLNNVDALVVRSISKVNAQLIPDNAKRLCFVATASSGYDHIDTAFLASRGIQWRNAGGCNAISVAEYFISVIALAYQKKIFSIESGHLTCGVIGVGHVGKRVQQYGQVIGMHMIVNDPFRAESESDFAQSHSPLSDFTACDIVTIHTPLTITGRYPTYHILNEEFLNTLKPHCLILNAARGEVLDTSYLNVNPRDHRFVLDTFPNEPKIDTHLQQSCFLATPHIAGHASESKRRTTQLCYESTCDFFKIDILPPSMSDPVKMIIEFDDRTVSWQDVVLKAYNPESCHQLLNNNPTNFQLLRNTYSGRHEFSQYEIHNAHLTPRDYAILKQLGFDMSHFHTVFTQ